MPAGSAAHDVMYGSYYLPKNRTDRRIAYVHIVYTTTIAGLSALKEIKWEVLRLEGEKEGKGRLVTIPCGMLHFCSYQPATTPAVLCNFVIMVVLL